jgi:hypothetical protein
MTGRTEPFIEVRENKLIAVSRITSVDFIPEGRMLRVGKNTGYGMDVAKEWALEARERGEDPTIHDVATPILLFSFVNDEGMSDAIRLNGKHAKRLWEFFLLNYVAFFYQE